MALDHFYVYAYVDPRKPGKYAYDEYAFDFEPFYVGKGMEGRCRHFKKHNDIVKRKVQKIQNIGIEPIIVKVLCETTEPNAFSVEQNLISLIGRASLHQGTLANLTDGGEGVSGQVQLEETKRIRAYKSKKWHQAAKLTQEYQDRSKRHGEYVRRLRADANSIYNSKEYRKAISEGGKRGWASKRNAEEIKLKSSESHKKNWATPGHRIASEETRHKRIAGIRAAWKNPESGYFNHDYKKMKNEKIRSAWNSLETRKLRCLKWIPISPIGEMFFTDDLPQFCTKYDLSPDGMRKVAYGKLNSYKNWGCIKDARSG